MAQKPFGFQTRYKIIHRTEELEKPQVVQGIATISLDAAECVEPVIEYRSMGKMPFAHYFIETTQQQANVTHHVRELAHDKIVWEITNHDEEKGVVIRLHYMIV